MAIFSSKWKNFLRQLGFFFSNNNVACWEVMEYFFAVNIKFQKLVNSSISIILCCSSLINYCQFRSGIANRLALSSQNLTLSFSTKKILESAQKNSGVILKEIEILKQFENLFFRGDNMGGRVILILCIPVFFMNTMWQ